MTRSNMPHAAIRPWGKTRPTAFLRGVGGVGGLGLLAVTSILASQPAFARGEQAGVSAAVRGEVELAEAKGIVGTQVESGQPIYLGDYITSSAGSGMQILLMDETVFTIGPNSEIAIDDFVYDPSNNQGHMTASITRGVVRVLTGKLAHNDPKTMKINLPVGSIGIRGTQFLVSIETPPARGTTGGSSNWSPKTRQFAQNQLGNQNPTGPIVGVVNLGPGAGRNDSGSRPGAVELTSLNGVTQPLSSEGFGAFMTGNTVTQPTRFPTELAGLDMSALVTRPGPQNRDGNGNGNNNGNGNSGGNEAGTNNGNDSGNNSGNTANGETGGGSGEQAGTLDSETVSNANNQTGQTVAQVLDTAITQNSVTNETNETSNETSQTNNDVHNDPDINNNSGTSVEAATYDAMRDISAGDYYGANMIEGPGLTYFSETNVDFGSRIISTSFSGIMESQSFNTKMIDPGQQTKPTEYRMDMTRFYDDETSGPVVFTNKDFQDISEGCLQIGCQGKVVFKTPTSVEVELSTDAVSDPVKGSYDLEESGQSGP